MLLEAYGDAVPSYPNCPFRFQWFKSGGFDINCKKWPGESKSFEDNELLDLLDQNPVETLQENDI